MEYAERTKLAGALCNNPLIGGSSCCCCCCGNCTYFQYFIASVKLPASYHFIFVCQLPCSRYQHFLSTLASDNLSNFVNIISILLIFDAADILYRPKLRARVPHRTKQCHGTCLNWKLILVALFLCRIITNIFHLLLLNQLVPIQLQQIGFNLIESCTLDKADQIMSLHDLDGSITDNSRLFLGIALTQPSSKLIENWFCAHQSLSALIKLKFKLQNSMSRLIIATRNSIIEYM